MVRRLILILLLLVPMVHGLGVAQDFLEDNVLRLLEGETHYFRLTLQNPEDIQVAVTLTVESEIAEVYKPKEYYNLSPKSYSNEVFLEITAPNDAKLGESFPVTYIVQPISIQGDGQIGMNMKLRRSFDVVIVDEDGVGYNKYITRKNRAMPFGFSWIKIGVSFLVFMMATSLVVLIIAKKTTLLSQKLMNFRRPLPKLGDKLKKDEENSNVGNEIKQETSKEVKIETSEKIVKTSKWDLNKQASPEQYFFFSNGTTLKSVMDLYYYLKVIPDDSFARHVTGDKNDFASWIKGVFQYYELADKIQGAKTKQEIMDIIDNEKA